jgi:hypothetical protein
VHPFIFLTLVKVIIQPVHLGIYEPRELVSHPQAYGAMKAVVVKQHPKRKDLQHQEGQKGKIPPDKKKNIAHWL